ncbi:ABC transporter ATP-binding protein/permease [Acidimicrobiia bacterium EGI L10123]|uniref:ABC transporter ATP-binding protein n=1 Tax=Salinilacustrithrix flava TaxID=2957203 RepID=UPI003D7C2574|nr:ABC transporter ATP-binding protein/permease [Acidimicrobiia bacterium EGI L10123]
MDDDRTVEINLPIVGSLHPSAGVSLLVATGAGVVVLLIHLHSAWLTADVAAVSLRGARDRAIKTYSASAWAQQSADREGALQETVTTISYQIGQLVVSLSTLVSSLIPLAMLLGVAAILQPLVTSIVLLFGGMLFLALHPIASATRRRANDYVQVNSRFAEAITEWTGLALELRVFGVARKRMETLSTHNRAATDALRRSRFLARAGSWLLRDLAVLFLVVAAGVLYLSDGTELAAAGTVVLLIVRSLAYAQNANTALQGMNEQAPGLEEFCRRMRSLEAATPEAGLAAVGHLGDLDLRGVSYEYSPGVPTLRGVTMHIEQGECIGLVGPSGGGKSTLAQVLLRLRTPSSGDVTAGGLRYEEIDDPSWSKLVSFVPQEPRLFEGTVAENIAFFRDATIGQIEEVAHEAGLLDEIRSLPQAMQTVLGPRGSGLSGGQRQRLAFARALLGRPELLILDEPTSALDLRSEALLQETIVRLKGHVTCFIVAHRLTTLGCCDRVFAMEGGTTRLLESLDEAQVLLSQAHEATTVGEADQHSPAARPL